MGGVCLAALGFSLGLGGPWTSQTCFVEGMRSPAFQAIFLLLDKSWIGFPHTFLVGR